MVDDVGPTLCVWFVVCEDIFPQERHHMSGLAVTHEQLCGHHSDTCRHARCCRATWLHCSEGLHQVAELQGCT